STYPRRSERNGPLALPGHARSLSSRHQEVVASAWTHTVITKAQSSSASTEWRMPGRRVNKTSSAEHDSFLERVKTDRSLYDSNSDLSFGLMLAQCFTPRENGQNNAYVFVLGENGRALSLVG